MISEAIRKRIYLLGLSRLPLTYALAVYHRFHRDVDIGWADFVRRDRVCVFHHLPKSGGTSIQSVLSSWFFPISDFQHDRTASEYVSHPFDIGRLRNLHYLCGHYHRDGSYLHQRYPRIFIDERYKVVIFVRDPLQLRISLYYFGHRIGAHHRLSLAEHLSLHDNHMARLIPCTDDDYQTVLSRYWFIGIAESAQESIDELALRLGKPRRKVPVLNTSPRDEQVANLPATVIDEFKARNALDYKIYDYSVQHFRASRRTVEGR